MKKKLLIFLSIALIFCSCDDLFEPANQNIRDIEAIYGEPLFAQGILLNGYARIPGYSFNDVATDDAVSNDINNAFRRAATGQWASNMDPFSQWQNAKAAIQYLNIMLKEVDKVAWANNEVISKMFADRMKGEAYGLRALFMFQLLQNHSGWSNGQLLGVPIVLEPEDANSNFNKPRNTFEECMQQIYSDLKNAEELLPLDYKTISNISQVPEKYRTGGEVDILDRYNRVFGEYAQLRMTARIAKAIKAQAALLAASPAFSTGNKTTWENAAAYAGEVLMLNGGVSGIDPNGGTWYANTAELAALASGSNQREILWRADVSENNTLERQHFPPTLFGSGRINPTQNLVNSFPMNNGFPITNPSSNFNPAAPYANRDPRLAKYILVNGGTAGVSNATINTAADSPTNDGLRKAETSTQTGYYLRKLLRQDVNLNPSSTTNQRHFQARIRYTELYLIYAEAANEAWGPTGTGSFGFSAYDVIAAIRRRAGITQPDNYLESVRTNKDAMRELIRNERRLELCFEGFRFWDLRRWKAPVTEPARGIQITNGNNFQTIQVQDRLFADYMYHGPIPYSEILKFNALQQNTGW
jgi:starch-binding outer membrane protein, SusD/RagB family